MVSPMHWDSGSREEGLEIETAAIVLLSTISLATNEPVCTHAVLGRFFTTFLIVCSPLNENTCVVVT